MRKRIWALDELWLGLIVDLKLNFTDNGVIKFDIDQNIVGTLPKPIFDPYNFEFLRVIIASFHNLPIDLNDLFLFWWALASHQIAYFEGDEIRWSVPSVPFVFSYSGLKKSFGNLENSVDKSIQIKYDVRAQVSYHMGCEHSIGLFQLRNEGIRIFLLQIFQKYYWLLQIIMGVKFFLEL